MSILLHRLSERAAEALAAHLPEGRCCFSPGCTEPGQAYVYPGGALALYCDACRERVERE